MMTFFAAIISSFLSIQEPVMYEELGKTVTIFEALDAGVIQIDVEGKGGYSGECLEVKVVSQKGGINVIVPPGVHFIAEDDPNQDIFVVEEQMLSLKKGDNSFNVEGFCSQVSDRSPESGAGFSLQKTKNDDLQKLANFMSGKNFDEHVKQDAVWCVSDNDPVSYVGTQGSDLRKFLCELKGVEDVWYETKRDVEVTPQREVVRIATEVKGTVKYEVKNPGTMRLAVYKEDGTLRQQLFDGLQMKQRGETEINFKGKVKGWDEGVYFVKVFIDEVEIHAQRFEV